MAMQISVHCFLSQLKVAVSVSNEGSRVSYKLAVNLYINFLFIFDSPLSRVFLKSVSKGFIALTSFPWFPKIDNRFFYLFFSEFYSSHVAFTVMIIVTISKIKISPGRCGSVDWAPACKPKGCHFNSQSGHMPGLWVRSPVWGSQEATTYWCFSPFLSPSLPLFLKINE